MDFIVVETQNNFFYELYVINFDNLLELRSYIKQTLDTNHSFYIYDIDGNYIEIYQEVFMNDIFYLNSLSNKLDNSKYCLFWKSYDIYRVAFFNNRLKNATL